MKRFSGLLLILILTACQGSGQAAPTPTPEPQWVNFHSDEGGFGVLMPAAPEIQLWSNDLAYGGIYTATYQGMTYTVIFNILAANPLPPDQLLLNLRDEHAADLKAKLLSSNPIDFNGYPGLAYALDAPKSRTLPEGAVVQGRIYYINDRVYIIYHSGAKRNSLLPDIKKFLGSLKIDGMIEVPTPEALAPYDAAPEGWQEFASTQDGFSVRLPGQPKREAVSRDKSMDTATYFVQDGLNLYGVMSFTFKDAALAQSRSDALFDLTLNSLLESMGGSVVSKKPIQLRGYAGQEVLITLPKGQNQSAAGRMLVRLYLARKHIYGVMAVTLSQDTPSEVTQFLNSFNVLEPQ
jgi:hypothetical protein